MSLYIVVNDQCIGDLKASDWRSFEDWAHSLAFDDHMEVIDLATIGECPRPKRLYSQLNHALVNKPPRRPQAKQMATMIRAAIEQVREAEDGYIRICGGEYDGLREQIRQATMYNNALTVDDECAESEGGYYQFIDRDIVDPMLDMTWAEYLRAYGMQRSRAREVIAFCVEPMPDRSQITDILARRNLRWTMARSKPQYHFLAEAIDPARYEGFTSPSVGCCPDDAAVVLSVAVEAYLQQQIDRATLHSVYKINAIESPTDWLEISDADRRAALRGWRPANMAQPIYAWQGADAHLNAGDTALGTSQTRRFVRLIMQAWQGNWPAPRLRLPPGKQRAPRFRYFAIARNLHKAVGDWEAKRPSLFRRFE